MVIGRLLASSALLGTTAALPKHGSLASSQAKFTIGRSFSRCPTTPAECVVDHPHNGHGRRTREPAAGSLKGGLAGWPAATSGWRATGSACAWGDCHGPGGPGRPDFAAGHGAARPGWR